ncbi:hypothetical protein [Burkholderia lata]
MLIVVGDTDLVERIATQAPLTTPKSVGMYGSDRAGYVDHARLDATGQAA